MERGQILFEEQSVVVHGEFELWEDDSGDGYDGWFCVRTDPFPCPAAGCSFVAAGRDAALCAPGISALFEERSLPLAGAGIVGPEDVLRETLAEVLALEGIQLTGSASLSTRAEERGAQLWGGPDRTSEMGLGSAWAGGAFELSLELRGQVALHLAARALDAALLVDLAARARRTGAQEWMGALFAAPLGTASPHEAPPLSLSERRERLLAELPALARSAGREAA